MTIKYDPIKNPNYVATIIKVPALAELDGLDNLRAIQVFGMQALVSKDTTVGSPGVLFSTEVQLSEEFASDNNLFRHSDLNRDKSKTGYLEDSRRVKAIKLRGHRSDSIFLPLDEIRWYKDLNPNEFKVGDVFDSINGHEILKKYVIKEPGVNRGPSAKIRRVDLKVFPLHTDTENYWRNEHKIPQNAPIVVTQKLHGTSVRYGKVPVLRTKGFLERLANKLGFPTTANENKFVVGSRMVVKSIDYKLEDAKDNFYATDLWTEYAQDHSLADLIPTGYLVYGEIVGFTKDGAPIQKDYTYEQTAPGTVYYADDDGVSTVPGSFGAKLYVYRVATITPEGVMTDLSWPATKAFAKGLGLATVPEIMTTVHDSFVANSWVDENFYIVWSDNAEGTFVDAPVRLSDAKSVDEGVVVRYDGPNGIYLLKAKSPIFLGHESAMLDEGAEDLEAAEVAE